MSRGHVIAQGTAQELLTDERPFERHIWVCDYSLSNLQAQECLPTRMDRSIVPQLQISGICNLPCIIQPHLLTTGQGCSSFYSSVTE